jgi:hypothetical protein
MLPFSSDALAHDFVFFSADFPLLACFALPVSLAAAGAGVPSLLAVSAAGGVSAALAALLYDSLR